MNMKRIAIIGLGAVGSYFYEGLEKLGDRISLYVIAEGERKERLQRDGITINGVHYTPTVVEYADDIDLILVATKYGALRDVLPVIKVISASFIHVFFLFVLLIIAAIYGYYPGLITFQLVYYSFCMFALLVSLSYFTSSVVVFFRDLSQIIQILLQIGMWATPILWNIDSLPRTWQLIMKLNPVAYIVLGYRATVCEKRLIISDWKYTIYFWVITLLFFLIGRKVFNRLKEHFADVL